MEKPSGGGLYNNGLKYKSLYLKGDKIYSSSKLGAFAQKILKGKEIIKDVPDFSKVATEISKGKIYETEDNFGKSYYFRGAVEDNYVKFAGFYWRIIRINGDSSIRLIYDGTQAYPNSADITGESIDDRRISTLPFNSLNTDNSYVGLRYKIGEVHGTEIPSNILGADEDPKEGTLNYWYIQNILNKELDKYISKDTGFICDRNCSTNLSITYTKWLENNIDSGGTSDTATCYAPYMRLANEKNPTLKYINENDYFTITSSKFGNKSLKYPVGLITADEISFAGGVYGEDNENINFYLYDGLVFSSMSPSKQDKTYPAARNTTTQYLELYGKGFINSFAVATNISNRSVINLKGNLKVIGSGTMKDPYVIE